MPRSCAIPVLMTLIAAASVAGCGSITAIEVGDGGSGGAVGTGGRSTGTGGDATGTGGSIGGAGGGGGGGSGGGDAAVDSRVDATDARNDADAPDAPPVMCQGLNEAMCRARPECAAKTCAGCGGQQVFAGCYRPGIDTPPGCAAVPCPTCAGLSEAACKTRMDCRSDSCPGCMGQAFARCSMPTDPPLLCPVPLCPPPRPCSEAGTLVECEARSDCHSVFVDKHNCQCAGLGCCAVFSRCADGDRASCKGMPACDALAPYCEGPYVVSYTGSCYEGCVQMKDCAP